MVEEVKYLLVKLCTCFLRHICRGLHFVVRFFECIIEDTNEDSENLSPHIKVAYAETLERYHGWMGSQLFKVLIISKTID